MLVKCSLAEEKFATAPLQVLTQGLPSLVGSLMCSSVVAVDLPCHNWNSAAIKKHEAKQAPSQCVLTSGQMNQWLQ